jgi:hypothetical protein
MRPHLIGLLHRALGVERGTMAATDDPIVPPASAINATP